VVILHVELYQVFHIQLEVRGYVGNWTLGVKVGFFLEGCVVLPVFRSKGCNFLLPLGPGRSSSSYLTGWWQACYARMHFGRWYQSKDTGGWHSVVVDHILGNHLVVWWYWERSRSRWYGVTTKGRGPRHAMSVQECSPQWKCLWVLQPVDCLSCYGSHPAGQWRVCLSQHTQRRVLKGGSGSNPWIPLEYDFSYRDIWSSTSSLILEGLYPFRWPCVRLCWYWKGLCLPIVVFC